LVRMMGMMSQPGVDLTTFNWNRLCLLHGPPGSGKSTLCRALAQKLSIRLGGVFLSGQLVEVNANAMLSKYFGESGKLIESTFAKVRGMAEDDNKKLIVVVIDEVETIAGSRQRASDSGECNDGLRVSLPSMFVAHTTSPYQRTSTAARARGTADVSTESIYRVLCGTWTRAIFLWRHNQQHREQCVHGEYCTDILLGNESAPDSSRPSAQSSERHRLLHKQSDRGYRPCLPGSGRHQTARPKPISVRNLQHLPLLSERARA